MAALLLVAAFLSGTAALAAEVVWFRSLGRGVGTTAEALALVSAAFLGGLGIGAALSSRVAPSHKNPLRAAAWCEMCAGVLIFLSPLVLAFVPDAHLAVLHLLGLEPGRSSWPAAVVALPILVIPTAFLGATLPFLVRGALRDVARAGRATGWLYGVNTLGAAAGVWLATWHLLPGFGETASLRLAASGNLLAALLLVIAEGASRAAPAAAESALPADVGPPMGLRPGHPEVSARIPPAPPTSVAAPLTPHGPNGRAVGMRALLPAMTLFLTGALALAGEVAWFRLLEPITGIHVYGFAILLGAVLLGTALGGALGGRLADQVRRPDLAMAWALALGAGLLVLSVWTAGALPWYALREGSAAALQAKPDGVTWDALRSAGGAPWTLVREAGWDALRTARVVGAFFCIAPPLIAFAAAYPLAVRARSDSAASAAGSVGSLYAWNTAGNVVGSLLAGFLLLPAIGGPRTLAALGGLGIAAAAALLLLAPRPRSPFPALALALPLALLALPGTGRTVDAAGPALPEVAALGSWDATYRVRSRADMEVLGGILGGVYPRPAGRPDADPILPREGVMSSVGLLAERGFVRLRQGGQSESRIQPHDPDAGSETEVALALLPWLIHPNAKDALVIGHGAGWTAEAMISTGLRTVVAELEPAVLDVSEEYRGPLLARRARNATLEVTDGRLLLREAAGAGGAYDLIVSQPSHPWVPGAGHLFTREAYLLARSALRPGGVFAQWLNIFNMSRELFQTALKSWYEAFPSSWVLLYNDEVILVGFTAEATIDVERWRTTLADSPAGTRARAAGIEGPEDLLRRILLDGDTLGRLLPPERLPSTDDRPLLELGLAGIRFTKLDDAWKEKEAILTDLRNAFPPGFERMIPDRGARDRILARTARRILEAGTLEDARRFLRGAPFDGGVEGRMARAEESLAGSRAPGIDAAERAQLVGRAADLLLVAREMAPGNADVAIARLTVLVDAGRLEEAIREGEIATAAFPEDGRVWAIHARALITNGDTARADQAFTKALDAKGTAALAGTGHQHARLLTTPLDGPPTRGAQERARAALRKDPGTFEDREALRALELLEIELDVEGPDAQVAVEAVARQRRELERRQGFEQLQAAMKYVDRDAKRGLEAAREASSLIPNEAAAWRARAWFELRRDDPAGAATSLRKAISLAKDADAERKVAVGYLRIFGHAEGRLEEAK